MYNSDVYDGGGSGVGNGPFPGTHSGDITSSSINLTNHSNVVIEFYQYARANASSVSTLLDISIDNGLTWVNFPINATITSNNATTPDDKQIIDISSVAGGQSNVKIRFTWNGRYYFWLIDDVRVMEAPNNNLALVDYFYPPASYETPFNQTTADTFRFETVVSNVGAATQHNVKIFADVLYQSNTIWTDSMVLNSLLANEDTVVQFNTYYVPNLLNPGDYEIRYSVSSDSTDFDISNNSLVFPFEISDTVFQMSSGVTGAVRPGAGGDYMMANVYKTASGFSYGDYRATTIDFTVAKNTADGPLNGNSVTFFLAEVASTVNEDWSNFNTNSPLSINSDLTIVGFNTYTFNSSASNYDDFQVELQDFTNGGYGVALKPSTRYLVIIEYTGVNNVIFTGTSDLINRQQVSTLVYDGFSWQVGGFGPDRSAVLSMNIEFMGTVSPDTVSFAMTSLQVDEDIMTVFVPLQLASPNLQNIVNVGIQLDASSTATLGTDFTLDTSYTAIFPIFGTSTFYPVSILLDNLQETDETIVLNLVSTTSNVNLGADTTFTIIIKNVIPDRLVAVNDSVSVPFEGDVNIPVLTNDSLFYGLSSLNILNSGNLGNAFVIGNSTIQYTPNLNTCGIDTLIYEICDAYFCDTASIIIDVACPQYPLRTIDEVTTENAQGVADSIDIRCELVGTVHGIDFDGTNGYFFTVIDATGGINVSQFYEVNDYSVNEGDQISIKGVIAQDNGLTQILADSIRILGTDVLMTPLIITAPDENTESRLVKIEAGSLIDPTEWTNSGNSFTVRIRNATDTIDVLIDNDCSLYNEPAPTGWFNIIGIGSQFDNNQPFTEGYLIMPRDTTDIEFLVNVVEKIQEDDIQFFPNPANDWLEIRSTIELTAIRITNTIGQEIGYYAAPNPATTLNVSYLARGAYNISFITSEGILTKKFIKR